MADTEKPHHQDKGDGQQSDEAKEVSNEETVVQCEKKEEESKEVNKETREEAKEVLQFEKNEEEAKGENGAKKEEETKIDLSELENIPQMMSGILSDDLVRQLEATTKFRKLLSLEQNPPIEVVVNAGAVPVFVKFLSYDSEPRLQFEAAWALTNIASGSSAHRQVIIDNAAVPILVKLLESPNEDVREQAVWGLGNIAGDSPKHRDVVLALGVMSPLLNLLRPANGAAVKISMARNAAWTLSNLCRGKPQPRFELVLPALTTLAQMIFAVNDEDVLVDTCWALSYLSDGSNDKIQTVLDSGVVPKLVALLSHPSMAVQTPVLRTIGNIATGDDLQTQVLLNLGILNVLCGMLSSTKKKGILKECCWTISNITAGNRVQIQSVIDANIVPALIRCLSLSDFDIKKEAAWAITNVASGGNNHQIRYLVEQKCVKALCDILSANDNRVIMTVLEGLDNILRVGERDGRDNNTVNTYTNVVDEAGGVDKLQELKNLSASGVADKAKRILGSFFSCEIHA